MMKRAFAERGQGLVEYALLLVFLAAVIFIVLTLMGPIVGNMFSTVTSQFPQ